MKSCGNFTKRRQSSTSPKEITLGELLKSQYELPPFGVLCNLIAIMHNTSKFYFAQFNLWMLISFLLLLMIDLYIGKDVPAFLCPYTFSLKKLLLRNY